MKRDDAQLLLSLTFVAALVLTAISWFALGTSIADKQDALRGQQNMFGRRPTREAAELTDSISEQRSLRLVLLAAGLVIAGVTGVGAIVLSVSTTAATSPQPPSSP